MAGFNKNHKYAWKIDFGAFYCEFEGTSKEAFNVKSKLCYILGADDVPMYCNGELI